MSKPKKTSNTSEHTQSFSAGQVAAGVTANHANATDEMVDGMDIFRQVAEATGGNPVKHGNLFECIEAARFNVNAALKGSNLNAQVTACPADPDFPKDPHHPADVVIRDGNEVMLNVQSKAYQDPVTAAFELKDGKYTGMDRLVPTDKEASIKELLESRAKSGSINSGDYRDAAEHLKSKLEHGEVSSEGTTYQDAIFSKNHPNLYSSYMEFKQLSEEVGATARVAGLTGFVIGGTISALKTSMAVKQGRKNITEAVINSAKDGVKVGAKGAVIGGTGAVIRFGAENTGIEAFSKSNVATAIAAGVINTGVTIYSFAKGEVDAQTAMERLGQTGVSTIYGLFAGSAMGVIFTGPAAVTAATIAGYLLANSAYQSCIAILNDAKLAEEKSKTIHSICCQAAEEMKKQQDLFEQQVDMHLELSKKNISVCFSAIDKSMDNNNPDRTLSALRDFACLFGKQLRFINYDDFDEFMQQPDSKLKI